MFQVLYVEDQPAVAAVILLELQRVGVEITTAHNAERALELARQKPFDLILMDVLLPGDNGFDLCRLLKKDDRLKALPVIFLTGVPTTQGRNEAIGLGAMGYLSKATDRSQLGERIMTAVGLARATAASLAGLQPPRQVDSRN